LEEQRVSQRPTLHDVSAAAQVSIYTVSKALSGGTGVSEATRQRVLEIAAQIGYVPNHHARSLKSPQSTVVAVLTANSANQYYSVLVSSLETAIEQDGYSCITMDAILNGSYSQSREDRFVASIMAQRVAAVVVTYNLSEGNMKALAAWGVPLIFVDCVTPQGFDQYSSVNSDSYLGSFEMGVHLAGHGYKRWAFVGHTRTWSSREPRQKGFEAAAVETGCTVDILEGQNSSATAREAVVQYLVERPRNQWPEVFYASNTVLLHGIFDALRSLGISIPRDMAVVAFDDFEWAEMLDPPITVVDQDIRMIGRAAGSFLLRALKDDVHKTGESVVLKPNLRVRQSCGCGSAHLAYRK
jgi:LacI family transcriptional regulator